MYFLKLNKRTLDLVLYFAIIVFAILFLFFGNRLAREGMAVEFGNNEFVTTSARVTNIIDIVDVDLEWFSETIITFEARLTSGDDRNLVVIAEQVLSDYLALSTLPVEEGDRVLLIAFIEYDGGPSHWYYMEHVRINTIIILGAVFVALLLFFGRLKGLNAILSLGFTCMAIFTILIPAILSGRNIYITAIIICVFSIIVTLFIVYGVNKKSLAAVAGCFGGVIAASLLTLFMNSVLNLTGLIDSESQFLLLLPTEAPINLRAIIFAGIIIGAVGAVMDVAVSISSALTELKEQAPDVSYGNILKSGINIGRDIMGSMTNTLVLAYIGSSLSVLLLLVVYADSFLELFNRELVIVELLQALIGSLGILTTMPLTALICAFLLTGKHKPETPEMTETPEIQTDNTESFDRYYADYQKKIDKKLKKYKVSAEED
jgi:uncharacterized membrane protein